MVNAPTFERNPLYEPLAIEPKSKAKVLDEVCDLLPSGYNVRVDKSALVHNIMTGLSGFFEGLLVGGIAGGMSLSITPFLLFGWPPALALAGGIALLGAAIGASASLLEDGDHVFIIDNISKNIFHIKEHYTSKDQPLTYKDIDKVYTTLYCSNKSIREVFLNSLNSREKLFLISKHANLSGFFM